METTRRLPDGTIVTTTKTLLGTVETYSRGGITTQTITTRTTLNGTVTTTENKDNKITEIADKQGQIVKKVAEDKKTQISITQELQQDNNGKTILNRTANIPCSNGTIINIVNVFDENCKLLTNYQNYSYRGQYPNGTSHTLEMTLDKIDNTQNSYTLDNNKVSDKELPTVLFDKVIDGQRETIKYKENGVMDNLDRLSTLTPHPTAEQDFGLDDDYVLTPRGYNE